MDTREGIALTLWLATARGPRRLLIERQEAVCFFPERQRALLEDSLQASGAELTRRTTAAWRVAATKLKNLEHEPVMALYAKSGKAMAELRRRLIARGVELSEADVRPVDRFLMERFVTGSLHVPHSPSAPAATPVVRPSDYRPRLTALSFDIETDRQAEQLYSIGCYSHAESVVFMVGDARWRARAAALARELAPELRLEILGSERAVISAFVEHVGLIDPDVLLGWNVVNFDLRCLQRVCDRLRMPLALGRAAEGEAQEVSWREARDRSGARATRYYATIPGRCALDGIELMRSATYGFENFSLEFVARAVLGRGKLVDDVAQRGAEITTLFAQDKVALARYNLEDCKLVWDIFEKERLLEFAIEKSMLTGLELDRYGGSGAALDFLYLLRLHRRGYVAPASGLGEGSNVSPGGYVLDSQPGIFEDVLVLDFKSLYPSIMRTFQVDPLALARAPFEPTPIGGFDGGRFARDGAILPELIENLWSARDRAKAAGDKIMSQAIKIIMNSFYGVLGTPSCRFLDARLVSSITKRGHQIILRSQEFIEARGYRVIYGDTDSVFVLVPQAEIDRERRPGSDTRDDAVQRLGQRLAAQMTDWWRETTRAEEGVESFLEMEFETHFLKFLMPTIRGTDAGSKKRYAGMVRDASAEDGNRLVFKGLESARSDWSPLAREFQRELYGRVFRSQPYADFIYDTVASLRAGELDSKLVFRKRIRRRLDDYVKNVPPHIQAARKAELSRRERGLTLDDEQGGAIEYIMTRGGAEPIEFTALAPDYEFYIERQLEPIADAILGFLDDSMDKLFGRQIGLF